MMGGGDLAMIHWTVHQVACSSWLLSLYNFRWGGLHGMHDLRILAWLCSITSKRSLKCDQIYSTSKSGKQLWCMTVTQVSGNFEQFLSSTARIFTTESGITTCGCNLTRQGRLQKSTTMGRFNWLGWADRLIGLSLVKTSHATLFSISGLMQARHPIITLV